MSEHENIFAKLRTIFPKDLHQMQLVLLMILYVRFDKFENGQKCVKYLAKQWIIFSFKYNKTRSKTKAIKKISKRFLQYESWYHITYTKFSLNN